MTEDPDATVQKNTMEMNLGPSMSVLAAHHVVQPVMAEGLDDAVRKWSTMQRQCVVSLCMSEMAASMSHAQ